MSLTIKPQYAVLRSVESFKDPRPSIKKRMVDGKALRKVVSIADQGVYTPPKHRIDPITILEAQAKQRIESLIPIRYERMLQSPFAFYRGGAAIMAQDLANQPTTNITVQLCGDMHVSNCGLFGTAEHRLVFGINDFDETLPGSWEWDMKRLVSSALIATDSMGGDKALGKKLVDRITSEYQKRIIEYAQMPYLDLAQVFIVEKDIRQHFSKEHQKKLDVYLKETKGQSNIQVLQSLTTLVGKNRKIINRPPLIEHFKKDAFGAPLEKLIDKALLNYASTLLADRQILFQYKEAQKSVLSPYLGESIYRDMGRRVVAGQHLLQGAPDIFLSYGAVQYDINRSQGFYLRQLRDMKGGIAFGKGGVTLETFPDYGKLFGWALALGHARSGDAAMIAGYWGQSAELSESLYSFAKSYAKQNMKDYEQFCKAVKSGKLKAAKKKIAL